MGRRGHGRLGILGLLSVFIFASRFAAAAPPQHGRWEPMPAFSDEFGGDSLDVTKWHDHNPKWIGRQPAFFSQKNVEISAGELKLTARAEDLRDLPSDYHTFTTSFVKSRARVLYGYFEARCKPMKAAVANAFWFYDDLPDQWTELDVFESGAGAPGFEHVLFMGGHVFRTPDQAVSPEHHLPFIVPWKSPYVVADEYHVYGLEWDPAEIRWYVDGNLVRTLENKYWHQPLYLSFDAEVQGQYGSPGKDDLPATFSIDYVRAWRKLDPLPPSPPSPNLTPGQIQERTIRLWATRFLLAVAGASFLVAALLQLVGQIRDRSRGEQALQTEGLRSVGIARAQLIGVGWFGICLLALAAPYFLLFVIGQAVPAGVTVAAIAYLIVAWRFQLKALRVASAIALVCIAAAVLCSALKLIPL